MAALAVPMIADWVSPPAAMPAARPLSSPNILARMTTVARPLSASTAAMTISRIDCRPSDRKNCGPLSKPTA